MKHLLIVYHSQSGSAARLAQAAAAGAALEAETVEVRLRRAADADVRDLFWADGVLFGASENFGYLSGGMLDFLARVFYPAQPRQLGLPYASFISAGNDGRGAVAQLERVASGFPLRRVADPVIVRGEVDEEGLRRCGELGQALAAGLALGIF
jgi:multimeric flavodoxin WrbA